MHRARGSVLPRLAPVASDPFGSVPDRSACGVGAAIAPRYRRYLGVGSTTRKRESACSHAVRSQACSRPSMGNCTRVKAAGSGMGEPRNPEAHSISQRLTRCRSSGPADWPEPQRGSLSHAARRSRCHGSSRRPPCANERMARQDHGRVGGIARSDTTPRFSSSRMLTARTRSLWSRRAFRTWPRSFSPPPADNCRRFASSPERCPGTRSASTRHRSSGTMRQTEGTSSNEPCV